MFLPRRAPAPVERPTQVLQTEADYFQNVLTVTYPPDSPHTPPGFYAKANIHTPTTPGRQARQDSGGSADSLGRQDSRGSADSLGLGTSATVGHSMKRKITQPPVSRTCSPS
mmetsp:Transcript_19778/g.58869  ORF Transcript_19778/g.58869 Transcript_19778/m.58869 type:complete len:112 (+) Transcript_19778:818-1153(+)